MEETPRWWPLGVELLVLSGLILAGHHDDTLSFMLSFGPVFLMPIAYLLSRLPCSRRRLGLHVIVLAVSISMHFSAIDFVDPRRSTLQAICVLVLVSELLWLGARFRPKEERWRPIRGLAGFAVVASVMFFSCVPIGAIAGPIDTWEEPVVARHQSDRREEFVSIHDPSGATSHGAYYRLRRPCVSLPFLAETLGSYSTGEQRYPAAHRFEWRDEADGTRSLSIFVSFPEQDSRPPEIWVIPRLDDGQSHHARPRQ